MDYIKEVNRVYEHLENEHVAKAVMLCLRITRNLQDYFYAAVFLREMYPKKREVVRILNEDINHLNKETKNFIWRVSNEFWIDTHTVGFSFGKNEDGEEKTLLAIGISEIDPELEQWERSIADLQVPAGMSPFDTAAFTDRYTKEKAEIRLRMKGMQQIKEQVKTRCLNYAIRLEKQLTAQRKSQKFLSSMHTEVNNYFKAHAEDVHAKLVKAADLVDINDPENFSLLLTEVRRAMKSCADYFYPPVAGTIKCSDGKERLLGDDQYMNRLHEFIATKFSSSSSRDLLRAELDYLSVFARRLNDLASKGVHADVTPEEAKQGLLGLYMFLFNVTTRLQQPAENEAGSDTSEMDTES